MEAQLAGAGHTFVGRRISARYSLAGYIQEVSGGIEYYETIKDLLKTAEEDWPSMHARLKSMQRTIFQKANMIINLSGDAQTLKSSEFPLCDWVLTYDQRPTQIGGGTGPRPGIAPPAAADPGPTIADAMRGEPRLRIETVDEGFVIPTQVNYVGKGGPLFSPGEQMSGSYSVVSRSLSTGYLWDKVRVVGGAYGGSCQLSPNSGTFVFLSFRDPNLQGTIAAYDAVADHLDSLALDRGAIEQDIIGTIGGMDGPLSPDMKGLVSMQRYLSGETLEIRQKRRDEIILTSDEDYKAMAKRLRAQAAEWRVSVFGSQTAFDEANAALPQEKKIQTEDIFKL